MEIEVKERLESKEDLVKVAKALGGTAKAKHVQRNFFFDGTDGQLSSKRASLRLRFFEGENRCVLTCKEGSVVSGGVGSAKETEEEVDFAEATKCAATSTPASDLGTMIAKISRIADDALTRYGVRRENVVVTGSFTTERHKFAFEGHTLELDETSFPFGTAYEIELETSSPKAAEELRAKLCSFLDSIPVSHSPSKKTKLACLYTKSLI